MAKTKIFEKTLVAYATFSIILFFLLGAGIHKKDKPVYDFKSNLIDAQVYTEDAQGMHECTWDVNRRLWSCSDRDWNTVARSQEYVNGKPVPCIWAHAIQDRTINVKYSQIPAGDLIVQAAFVDSAMGCSDDSPVQLDVYVNGNIMDSLTTTKTQNTADASILLSEDAESVKFMISTSNEACKHYCFNAEVR
ncbi:MAG: hypothetical protein ABH834_05135 [Candidatus Altiarchaeota archaeon]